MKLPWRGSLDLRDEGFTLIEVMVVIAIASTLMAIGVGGFREWALAAAHSGSASSIQSLLRQTQSRAMSEGVSFCVRFDQTRGTYAAYRRACSGAGSERVLGPIAVEDPRISITRAQFSRPDGSMRPEVTFKPTGTATAGEVVLEREGSTKQYTVAVETFTGRVTTRG